MQRDFVAELRCITCESRLDLHTMDATDGSGNSPADAWIRDGVLLCVTCDQGYLVKDGIPYMCRPSSDEAAQIRSGLVASVRIDEPDTTVEHRKNFDDLYASWGPLDNHEALDQVKANPTLTRQATESQLGAIFRDMPTGKNLKILDMGCGFGFDLELYAKRCDGAELYGIDVCSVILKSIIEHNITEKIALAFAERLPFSNNFFDFVVSHEVIEHVTDKKRGLQELSRVLKPGGRAVITTPNANSCWARVLEPLIHHRRSKKGLPLGEGAYDVAIPRREFEHYAKDAYLKVERWGYICPFYLTLTRFTPKLCTMNETIARFATLTVGKLYPVVPYIPGIRSLLCEQVTISLTKIDTN